MSIIDEIKAIQARFSKRAFETYVNGYSEDLTFEESLILKGTRASINDAIGSIYRLTGVMLQQVPGKGNEQLYTARIKGWAKHYRHA